MTAYALMLSLGALCAAVLAGAVLLTAFLFPRRRRVGFDVADDD